MKKVCVKDGCDQPRMVNKAGKPMTMCEAHQREYWREKAAESKARKAKGYGRGHGPAPTQSAKKAPPAPAPAQSVKAETPPPAPPRQQGGENKAVGHAWRQYPNQRPGASKMAKVCPVCRRTPAMAGLWARMGVICMGCRVTAAGVIA